MRHLTETEVALLAEGKGSDTLRAALSEHLSECHDCLEWVTMAALDAGSIQAADEITTAASEVPADQMEALRRLYREAKPFIMEAGRPGRVIRLIRIAEDTLRRGLDAVSGPVLPSPNLEPHWAADADEPPPTPNLPVLMSEDRSLLVRFRKGPGPDQFQAFVVSTKGLLPNGLLLRFPSIDRHFAIDGKGRSEIEGVPESELASGRIELCLTTESSDTDQVG